MATSELWQPNEKQIERLHKCLGEIDEEIRSPLPSRAWLSVALNACFWASLQVDEGRHVQGSLVFVTPDDCVQHLKFTKAEELNTKRIRELSQAVRSDGAALAATETGIWGVALQFPRDAVFLSFVGPGQLLLRRGERVLASVVGRDLVEHPDLDQVLMAAFPNLAAQGLRETIIDASVLMRQMGHGGAIAFVKELGDEIDSHLAIDKDTRYRNWAVETLAESELKNVPDNLELQARVDLERTYRKQAEVRLLEDIVQLTAIDGLLVLDDELRVLSVGAKIKAPDKPAQIELLNFPNQSRQFLRSIDELGGTRHQSAARLVWAKGDAIVLVVSQDGRSSLMARVADTGDSAVRVLRGFERTIPLDATTLRFGHYARSVAIAKWA